MNTMIKSVCAIVLVLPLLQGCITSGGKPERDDTKAVRDYLNLAQGYLNEGYVEQATRPLQRALEIDPRSVSSYELLAIIYQHQGELELAEQTFRKALDIDDTASAVHHSYGKFLLAQHRYDEAMAQFQRVADDIHFSQRSLAFENMGITALEQRKPAAARDYFQRALRLNRHLLQANLELAYLFLTERDFRQAWVYYQQFAHHNQQDAASLLLGIELAQANNALDEQASYALQLKQVYPESAEYRAYRSGLRHE